jgi:DNA-binding beta-propeller fold protein YncE
MQRAPGQAVAAETPEASLRALRGFVSGDSLHDAGDRIPCGILDSMASPHRVLFLNALIVGLAAAAWGFGCSGDTTTPGLLLPAPGIVNLWGTEGSAPGAMRSPWGLEVTRDHILVADTFNDRVQIFTHDGTLLDVWGESGIDPGRLNHPKDVAVSGGGSVYVLDSDNHRVQVFTSSGDFLHEFGGHGSEPGRLQGPTGLAIGPQGRVYVADYGNGRVQVFGADGSLLAVWPGLGPGESDTYHPSNLAVGPTGDVFVVDTFHLRIVRYTSDGEFVMDWGGGAGGHGEHSEGHGGTRVATPAARISLHDAPPEAVLDVPGGIAVDSLGRVYVTEEAHHHGVKVFTSDGEPIAEWGRDGTHAGVLFNPLSVGVAPSGDIYVLDTGNHRVVRFAPLDAEAANP